MAGVFKIRRRSAGLAALAALVGLLSFLVLDLAFPLPTPGGKKDFAAAVIAEDGSPLRAFPDSAGIWRYPVTMEMVSPLYLEALLNYEDRWFFRHPGVNPWSLARVLWLNLRAGRVTSGGSTLTMQTARLLCPHPRSIPGKITQVFRALQLEYHLEKKEILTLYLNYAPFGGTIEGVQAASFAYLGKPALELSHAEAALLAVLPQAPSRLRPDRAPEAAVKARDKILNRMADLGVWDRETVLEAMKEKVPRRLDDRPMSAPLLAWRLRTRADPSAPVRSLIDVSLQQAAAGLVRNFIQGFPIRTSAAVLVLENRTLAVRAYVGSADFLNDSRFGHVDMVQAVRSPGSTLKPFLYAFALEEGLIHSESLLVDAPLNVGGYRPGNFTKGFSGPVSASEALVRSLNIPAVDLLDRLGVDFFDARLRQGGLRPQYPPHGGPNPAMILGGVGVSLESLVAAYSAFGRQGLSGRPRFTAADPVIERRLMSPGAAFIIRRILSDRRRPDLPLGRISMDRSREAAWKTGTSYGFRDAWAIGTTDDFTVGVWVGRPDGSPSPGQYGLVSAAPLLFSIIDSLPRRKAPPPPIPDSVGLTEICWPLGTRPEGPDDPWCHERRQAFTLDGLVPPTPPDRVDRNWQSNPAEFLVNPATGLRLDGDCPSPAVERKTVALWPKAARPWLAPAVLAASAIPPLDPLCGRPVSQSPENIKIVGLEDRAVLRPQGASRKAPVLTLEALGGRDRLFWMANGEVIGQVPVGRPLTHCFSKPGKYRLTVMDQGGNHDTVNITVLAGAPD
ncbi:MAG: penicillin-binding protein 1C [Pseudomonadota bacterium]